MDNTNPIKINNINANLNLPQDEKNDESKEHAMDPIKESPETETTVHQFLVQYKYPVNKMQITLQSG